MQNIEYLKTASLMSRWVLIVMLSLIPCATLLPGTSPPSHLALYMHLAGMAWIAFLACASFETIRAQAGAVGFVFLFSALMELLQHFIPHRQGSLKDIGINAAGCLVGVGLFMIMKWLWKRLKAENNG